MPNPLFSFEDLQMLKKFQPEIINGTFTFDKDTIDQQFIDLSGNKDLRKIEFTSDQPNLRYLDASSCSLQSITIPEGCNSLEMLYLHSNQIKEITFEGDCPKLELLDLSDNKLTYLELPYSFDSKGNPSFKRSGKPSFENLGNLFLSNNQFVYLTSLSRFAIRDDFDLDIRENKSLKSPPAGIVEQGDEAVRNYFTLLEKEKADKVTPTYNFEVKLLIIGEGGTGKTTLLRKLQNEFAAMPEEKDTTQGIAIEKWEFPLEKNWFPKIKDLEQNTMQVNCWDFGGQKLYHGTHQIFFGENSFYVLVEETREQKTDFNYWFNTVEQLAGDNACLMVVINQKHGHVLKFDKTGYQGRFKFLHNVEELDLKEGKDAVISLQKLIKTSLHKMPNVGQPLSATYIKIREKLFGLEQNFISFDKLLDIAKDFDLTDAEQIRTMCRYFNDTGAITHFMDDPTLCSRVYLNSDWLVKTVYKVLDDSIIKNKKGRITKKDFDHIFNKEKLDFEVVHFTRIMHKFGLMYKVQDVDAYVVPAHLPTEKPYIEWQHKNEDEVLIFKYEFDKYMPEGLMSHFIVSLHPLIEDQKLVWHRGVNLCYERTYAEIIETYGGTNTFEIKITGAHKSELLAVIRDRFKKILKPFKKLEFAEKVPCNCEKCRTSNDIYFHEYKIMQDCIAEGDEKIQCLKSRKLVNVKALLGEVFGLVEEERGIGSSRFLKEMNEKLEEALMDTREIKEINCKILDNTEQLKQGQKRILQQFQESEQLIVSEIIKKYHYSQNALIEVLLNDYNQKQIDENDAKDLLQKINSRLDKISMDKKEALENQTNTELTSTDKLKLCIPFIPGILSYETEFGFESRAPIKSWKDIWKAFSK